MLRHPPDGHVDAAARLDAGISLIHLVP
jgi:hypothetical protein